MATLKKLSRLQCQFLKKPKTNNQLVNTPKTPVTATLCVTAMETFRFLLINLAIRNWATAPLLKAALCSILALAEAQMVEDLKTIHVF